MHSLALDQRLQREKGTLYSLERNRLFAEAIQKNV